MHRKLFRMLLQIDEHIMAAEGDARIDDAESVVFTSDDEAVFSSDEEVWPRWTRDNPAAPSKIRLPLLTDRRMSLRRAQRTSSAQRTRNSTMTRMSLCTAHRAPSALRTSPCTEKMTRRSLCRAKPWPLAQRMWN